MDRELTTIERQLFADPTNHELTARRFNHIRHLGRTLKVRDEEFEVVTDDDGSRVLILGTHEIDYDTPLEEQVVACRFDYANQNITKEHFPRPKDVKTSVKLFLFNLGCDATTEEWELAFKHHQLLATDRYQLLALSKRHPDMQREFPIIAHGSRWLDGYLFVPVLGGNGRDRGLYLSRCDNGWRSGCWFLGAR